MRKNLGIVAIALFMLANLYACDESRVFEQNRDIPEHAWHKDSTLRFEVEVPDAGVPYHVYYNLRNAVAYPAQNIYLNIEVQDSTGQVITRDLNNIELFDPKTGKPYGDGLGDIFDHQVRVFESFTFPHSGIYQFEVRHQMRDKIMVENRLPDIISVGIRVEKAVAGEDGQ
jgi:gliding motility-associated lipoprotein GldH